MQSICGVNVTATRTRSTHFTECRCRWHAGFQRICGELLLSQPKQQLACNSCKIAKHVHLHRSGVTHVGLGKFCPAQAALMQSRRARQCLLLNLTGIQRFAIIYWYKPSWAMSGSLQARDPACLTDPMVGQTGDKCASASPLAQPMCTSSPSGVATCAP